MHILIVDNEPNTCELFEMTFRMEGHQTHIAYNGLEAIKAVQHTAFDAIVMDIEMPEMDGLEAIRQVRTMPCGKQVPILVFTGYVGKDYYDKACQAGADDVVYKPIFPADLLKRLIYLHENRDG